MLEIFQYGFMVRAFAAGTMIGIIAPLIGTFLVIRRYSRLADTLAHVSLAGVAVGLLTRTDPVVSAIVISVSTAFCVEKLRFRKGIFGESVLALFLWSGMAVAVVIISIARGFNVGLFSFLFGSITTIAPSDLYFVGILGALVKGEEFQYVSRDSCCCDGISFDAGCRNPSYRGVNGYSGNNCHAV
jgi:zinc transport system permease protein